MKTATKSILFIALGLGLLGGLAFSTTSTRRLIARSAVEVSSAGVRAWSCEQLDPTDPGDQERLSRGLADPEPGVRKACADAIGRGGAEAAALAPALLDRSQDPESEVARAVAEALAGIGPAALPALIEALDGEDLTRRRGAAIALANLGAEARSAGPALARALKSDDPELRAAAVVALARIEEPGAAIPRLMPLRQDPHPSVRSTAEKSIGALVLSPGYIDSLESLPADQAWFAYPTAFQELGSQDAKTVMRGAATLKKMGPAGKDAMPRLMDLAKSKDAQVRAAALGALAAVFVLPKRADERERLAQAFSQALSSKDPELRALCVRALGQMPADRVARQLKARLADKDELVRSEAIAAVARQGADAVPGLIQSLSSRNEDSAASAGLALALIGGPAIRPLMKLLGGRNKRLSERAAASLAAMKGAAIPALLETVRGSDSARKQAAMVALVGMGASAVPELMRAYEKRDLETCGDILIIWEGMGEESAEALPLLAREIGVPRSPLRAGSLRVLTAIGPRAGDRSALIIPLLKNPDAELRQAAAAALGATAEPGPELIKALEAASGDADAFVSQTARASLERVRERSEETKE